MLIKALIIYFAIMRIVLEIVFPIVMAVVHPSVWTIAVLVAAGVFQISPFVTIHGLRK